MTSLEFVNIDKCKSDEMHPTWRKLQNPLDVERATVKTLLMIKRSPLTSSHVAGTRASTVCPLCKEEPETTIHFLLHCSVLQKARQRYIHDILNTCRYYHISIDPDNLCKMILDTNHLPKYDIQHEQRCRKFIYKLHSVRAVKLGGKASYCSFRNTVPVRGAIF